ncbi:major facilitator superfamily protein, partial [gut metagenome]
TLYMIPHTALIPEMIQDKDQRVNTYTWSSFFFVTGSAVGYATPAFVGLLKTVGLSAVASWRTTFAMYTVVGISLLLIPAFTIKEREYVSSVIPGISLKESLKHAFQNPHFRVVTLGQLLENTGMAFFQACIMYYVTVLMGLPETSSVLILGISIAGSLLLYPFVNRWAKQKGKRLPIIWGCLIFSVAEVVICFCEWIPGNKMVMACLFALFVSFPFAVLNVLPASMMADII